MRILAVGVLALSMLFVGCTDAEVSRVMSHGEAADGRLEIGEKRLRHDVRDEPIRDRLGVMREGACGHQQRLVGEDLRKHELLLQVRRLLGDDTSGLTDRLEAVMQIGAGHRLGGHSWNRRQLGDGVRIQLLHRLRDCRERLLGQTRFLEQVQRVRPRSLGPAQAFRNDEIEQRSYMGLLCPARMVDRRFNGSRGSFDEK